MENKDKNTTLIIVVIAAILLICCLLTACCAASVYLFLRGDSHITIEKYFNDNEAVIEKIEPETANETVASDDAVPADESSSIDVDGLTATQLKIIERAEKIRGLSVEEKLAPVFQSKDELRAYMLDTFYADADEQDFIDESELYALLGFVPEGFDTEQFYLDLYTEQIAGFYDTDTNKMYLIEGGSEIDNSLTLAHEYTHYLQYNNPKFSSALKHDDDYCDENGEMCVVFDAITEGDATLTEYLIEAEKDLELERNIVEYDDSETSVFDSAPKFFQDSLLFPYTYGYDFVSTAYLKGGFKQVDELYLNPPTSVEQIMHPEKYLKDMPTDVNITPFVDLISQSCEEVFSNVLNEADFTWLLGSGYDEGWRLSEKQVEAAATGWDGGSFYQARCEGKGLFFSKTVWDSEKDAQEAFDAWKIYSDKRFGSGTDNEWVSENGSKVELIKQNDIVFWMILPDTFGHDSLLNLINGGSAL